MQLIFKKNYSFLLFIFFSTTIVGHGFVWYTPIHLESGSKKDISTIYMRLLRDKISVTTYNTINQLVSNQLVETGKKSTSNSHIRLGFDYPYEDEDDIVCSPTQRFYVPVVDRWVPAYLLKIGDILLTKDLIVKPITYKAFIPLSIEVYILEIQRTHTFFVGKHAILTHNFLPVALNIGCSIPFGSTAIGAGFLGPIGITASIMVGGIITIASIATKIFRKHKTLNNENSRSAINDSCKYNKTPQGCFTIEHSTDIKHVYPTENPPTANTGCIITLEAQPLDKTVAKGCIRTSETKQIGNDGCFQQSESTKQLSLYSQEKAPDNVKSHPKKQIARNWKEFEDNCPIGQRWGKKFIHTGKQNPKDGAPIRQLIEDIPNTEMFKKGYQFAPDRFHDGDHFEVWDKYGEWIGVANLDGSRNDKKTNAETNTNSRNLRKSEKK